MDSKEVKTNEVVKENVAVANSEVVSTTPATKPESTETPASTVTSTPTPNPSPSAESTQGRSQIDKTFADLATIQNSVKKFKINDLIIPLLSVITLALLTIFVYVPMITSGIEFREESSNIKKKIVQLEKLNKDLDQVDIGKMQQDLGYARSVIPFSLQVSEFLSYVDDAAKENDLEFKQIVAGDTVVRSDSGTRGIDPVIKGVSGPVRYVGTLDDITAFVSQIQETSPFILSATQIKMGATTGDKWEISLNITGYYLNQATLPKVNIYNPFVSYSSNDLVIEKFKEKALLDK